MRGTIIICGKQETLTEKRAGAKFLEDLAGCPEEPQVVGEGGELHFAQALYKH
jgi:hypothetical protein